MMDDTPHIAYFSSLDELIIILCCLDWILFTILGKCFFIIGRKVKVAIRIGGFFREVAFDNSRKPLPCWNTAYSPAQSIQIKQATPVESAHSDQKILVFSVFCPDVPHHSF